MRFFIFLLILGAFIQSAFLPINICLILIVVRSFAVEEHQNYYLAFMTGIILAILSPVNIGFWTIILLFCVKFVHIIRTFPITSKGITIIPVALLLLGLTEYLQQLLFKVSFSITPVIIGGVLALPLYFIIRLWEERFVVKREIRLKI